MTSTLLLFGLASRLSGDVGEWTLSREDAETLLNEVLGDEPELAGDVYIVELEIPTSVN